MRSPESMSLGSTPSIRKERPLSSLIARTVSAQAGLPCQTKAVARKVAASRGITNSVNNGRDVDISHDHSGGLESLEYPNKMFMRRKHNSGSSPLNHIGDDGIQSISKQTEEADKYISKKRTRGTKRRGSIPINSARKKESGEVSCGLNSKITGEFHATGPERKSITSKEASVALENDSSVKHVKSIPVWLALRASDTKNGDNALPQIPKCYLRVLNGNVPVLYVKKYLVKKLGLKNSSDVELKCCGQSIVPRIPLYSLLEFWLECAAPSDWLSFIQEKDLDSAEPRFKSGTISPIPKEFLMVLCYERKSPRE